MNIKKSKKSMSFMPYVLLVVVVLGSWLFLTTLVKDVHE